MENEGNEMGPYHGNTINDSWKYELEFSDGSPDIYTDNILANSIIAYVNNKYRQQMIIYEIV